MQENLDIFFEIFAFLPIWTQKVSKTKIISHFKKKCIGKCFLIITLH